eukprot:875817-Rhodomonas_salina.2
MGGMEPPGSGGGSVSREHRIANAQDHKEDGTLLRVLFQPLWQHAGTTMCDVRTAHRTPRA